MDFENDKIIFEESENSLWMPVYTQPLHEFRLRDYFNTHGISNYLPVLPEWRIKQVNSAKKAYDYKRIVMKPMFRSYIFARLSREEKNEAWRSKSVIAFFDVAPDCQKKFISELKTVQMMEMLGQNSTIEFKSDFSIGDRFMIESGTWEGTYGTLVKKNKQFLWTVHIDCLQTFITAEIDPSEFKIRKVNEF